MTGAGADGAVALVAAGRARRGAGSVGSAPVRRGEEARVRGLDRVTDVWRRTYPDRIAVTVWVLGRSGPRGRGPA